jgi:cysteinyl-tRNA synthetase
MQARAEQAERDFDAGLADDLNTAVALAAVFDLIRDMNTEIDKGALRQEDAVRVVASMEKFDQILNLLVDDDAEKLAKLGYGQKARMSPEQVDALIEQRNAARKQRDFKRADAIRQQLAESGIIVEDAKDGSVRWKYK